jgi:hypothetical protein
MADGPSFTNPFDWWVQALNLAPKNLNQSILPGWSFLTINENNSTSPETEQYVLARHSYGRQIGRMMDLVAAMADEASPKVKKSEAYKKFEEVVADVEAAKDEAAGIRRQRLLDELKALRKKDSADFDALIAEARS